MATKYALDILLDDKYAKAGVVSDWETIALFSDKVPVDAIISCGQTCVDNIAEWPIKDVRILNMDTGEICWLYSEDGWNDYDEPDNCDDDCGFDPYMGCYTDDC